VSIDVDRPFWIASPSSRNDARAFVRHCEPCKALKTTLKAEIDAEAWESLYSGCGPAPH
jgi:hypothetical protein